ncbi:MULTISPECIES: hypothetical protein [unclassified Streptomyces]|uniref:hypothetical protein n=1 Tax=unclassified Streptomyces TaxID=2593676 RepID=UPI0033CC5FCD
MSFLARIFWRSLTAVLVSITVAWAPAASSAPNPVLKEEALLLTPATGPPETSVRVSFASCVAPTYISGITWDGDPFDFSGTDEPGVVDITVPAKAALGSHDVRARCATNSKLGPIYGTASFTVTAPDPPAITLDPTQGEEQTTVTVNGSQFNCSHVDLLWDSTSLPGSDVASEGTFSAQFQVPAGSTATTHTVRAACTDYPEWSGQAEFTVTDPSTNETSTTGETSNGDNSTGSTNGDSNGSTTGDTSGDTSGDTNGDTNGSTTGDTNGDTTGNATGTTGSTDGDSNGTGSTTGDSTGDSTGISHGGTATPVGWVVGPSLFGALLLLAVLFSLMNHRHRGPRWVHDHIRATLRSGAAAVALQEPPEDTGSANRTVRLEPHTDPGDQRLY